MTKPAAAQVTSNEPTQASIDAVTLGMIRIARKAKDKKQGELRSAYATADLRGLNTDAAKIAIKLIEQGGEAIDTHFEEFRKTAEYIKLMGKELTPSQYELFGLKQGPAPEDERGAIEGRAAGFMLDDEEGSQESSNPYPGSVKGQAWLTAFRQARAERNTVLAMKAPEEPEGSKPDGDAKGAEPKGEEGKA
jgi:hypothetical protein